MIGHIAPCLDKHILVWPLAQCSPVVSDCSRYDRNKLSLKEIMNIQYVSCMNPTSGSFTINPRLQVGEEPWPWNPKCCLTRADVT